MADDVEWDEWADEIIKAVSSGELDRYLRRIVRAAFERKWPHRLIPDRGLRPDPGSTLIPDDGPAQPDIAPVATGELALSSVACFDVKGKRYAKADVIGKAFYPDSAALSAPRGVNWAGVKFRVIEVNRVNAVVQIIRRPVKMNATIRRCYENGIPVVVDKQVLLPILEH